MDPALERLLRLRNDLEAAGRELYKLRPKEGGELVPFLLNDSQRALHEAVEAQRTITGWVRAIVLKGRQQGISTYIAARFYQKTSMRKGVNTYILTHEQPATDTLFGIVDRYHKHNPLAPHVGVSNTKELEFDKLDSSYAVATAGNKEGGRSKAITLFHGSEVAFWLNAKAHFAASVQGVPLMPGTEVFLESTSAGGGGEFYERYTEAEAGKGDYIPVFLPWWLDKGYVREPEPGFVLTQHAEAGFLSEEEYADLYKLSLSRMAWRRAKIIELRSPLLFQREYPADPNEAWTAPVDHEPFIPNVNVLRARKRTAQGAGPLILGVDPASNGGDRFSIAARRGMRVEFVRHRNKINHLEGAAWVKSLIDELKPARVFIDAGNIGAAIVTQLVSMGPKYVEIVRGVDFGAKSEAKLALPKLPGPQNRRAEMWARLRDWLDSEEGACLPDESALQADITAPKLRPLPNNDFGLESKKDMKARGVRSPDLADAVVLTFASIEFHVNYHDEVRGTTFSNDIDRPRAEQVPVYESFGAHGWMA